MAAARLGCKMDGILCGAILALAAYLENPTLHFVGRLISTGRDGCLDSEWEVTKNYGLGVRAQTEMKIW